MKTSKETIFITVVILLFFVPMSYFGFVLQEIQAPSTGPPLIQWAVFWIFAAVFLGLPWAYKQIRRRRSEGTTAKKLADET